MSGAHAAPKGSRRLQPVPDLPQVSLSPVADDLAEPPDDPRWAADLNATQPWAGPSPEPPAAAAARTDPDMDTGPAEPSPEWLDAVALDRETGGLLALAEMVLAQSAAERAARERDSIASRGRAALLTWAADGSAGAAAATRPYAMTAVTERPADPGDQK